MYSIWVESSSNQLTEIKKVIKTLSEEEDKDYFEPHVTLVTNLNSEHSAMNVFDKISKKSCLLYTSPSPRDSDTSRMPSSA